MYSTRLCRVQTLLQSATRPRLTRLLPWNACVRLTRVPLHRLAIGILRRFGLFANCRGVWHGGMSKTQSGVVLRTRLSSSDPSLWAWRVTPNWGRFANSSLVKQLLIQSFARVNISPLGLRISKAQLLRTPELLRAVFCRSLNNLLELKQSWCTRTIAWGHLRMHWSEREMQLRIKISLWQIIVDSLTPRC